MQDNQIDKQFDVVLYKLSRNWLQTMFWSLLLKVEGEKNVVVGKFS